MYGNVNARLSNIGGVPSTGTPTNESENSKFENDETSLQEKIKELNNKLDEQKKQKLELISKFESNNKLYEKQIIILQDENSKYIQRTHELIHENTNHKLKNEEDLMKLEKKIEENNYLKKKISELNQQMNENNQKDDTYNEKNNNNYNFSNNYYQNNQRNYQYHKSNENYNELQRENREKKSKL